jgi:hypothetical protein
MKLKFLAAEFRKVKKYQISRKSVRWEQSCSMWKERRAYGQTDMTKLMVAFNNVAKPPKSDFCCFFSCSSLSPPVDLFSSFGRRVISDLKD